MLHPWQTKFPYPGWKLIYKFPIFKVCVSWSFRKCIFGVIICSGMGATNVDFWACNLLTNLVKWVLHLCLWCNIYIIVFIHLFIISVFTSQKNVYILPQSYQSEMKGKFFDILVDFHLKNIIQISFRNSLLNLFRLISNI